MNAEKRRKRAKVKARLGRIRRNPTGEGKGGDIVLSRKEMACDPPTPKQLKKAGIGRLRECLTKWI